MRLVLFSLFTLTFSSGALPDEPFDTYEGVYRTMFEVSSFLPKGRRENWWLKGKVPCLETYTKNRCILLMTHCDPLGEETPPLYLKVEGTLSPQGRYGHLNSYSRELVLNRVLECRLASPDESK